METNNKPYEKFSFKSFLSRYHVVIPMIQRDYAQGRQTDDINRVRERFLNAIKPYLTGEKPGEVMTLDFVYGEVEKVWSKTVPGKLDRIIVTPLDGQQRLTTLFLLHWYAAKKEKIQRADYEFLYRFSYEIRPSSRAFCKHLIEFEPRFDKSFESQIIDQNWFMGEWRYDPTILSMLVMVDAIKGLFNDTDNLWMALTGEESKIVFYFLPLKEYGLSETLYIKMNARGKKLTRFEHFKAEYEALYTRDTDEANRLNHRFDVEWIDTLFPYRNEDDTVDREFMRFFFYVSHILCYEQSIEKTNDEFKLIDLLYNEKGRTPNPKAKSNRVYLESAFDCWYDVFKTYNGIDSFFKRFLSNDRYEKGKVATYKNAVEYNGTQNYFKACIKLYQVNNFFSYSDFLFLYGIQTYLINKHKIEEADFIERLRVLRNLIMNSNAGEIRGDADYMKDLLEEVHTLILSGVIKIDLPYGFNGIQEQEEIDKRNKKKELTEEQIRLLLKFEDHPYIYGFTSGLRYENLDLVDPFYQLFSHEDGMLIHRALISIGDYTQDDKNRYYMGNTNRSTWIQLLHKSNIRKHFEENTMATLIKLLRRYSAGESLKSIIDGYITEQNAKKQFDWRYYFAKYSGMLKGADGELVFDDYSDYIITTLNKHQFNGKHWNPFLNVVLERLNALHKKPVASLGDYGDNLIIFNPSSSLASTKDGFIYYHGGEHEDMNVKQLNGVDIEDRIEMAVNRLEKIISPA